MAPASMAARPSDGLDASGWQAEPASQASRGLYRARPGRLLYLASSQRAPGGTHCARPDPQLACSLVAGARLFGALAGHNSRTCTATVAAIKWARAPSAPSMQRGGQSQPTRAACEAPKKRAHRAPPPTHHRARKGSHPQAQHLGLYSLGPPVCLQTLLSNRSGGLASTLACKPRARCAGACVAPAAWLRTLALDWLRFSSTPAAAAAETPARVQVRLGQALLISAPPSDCVCANASASLSSWRPDEGGRAE